MLNGSTAFLLQRLPNRFPDISRPFLLLFNCTGMLLTGTLGFLGLFAYSERGPIGAKDVTTSSTLLGRVAVNVELWMVMSGTSLFVVFTHGFVAVVRMDWVHLRLHSVCVATITAVALMIATTVAVVPYLGNPLFNRLLTADILHNYGTNPDWDYWLDSLQSRLHCCGISTQAYRDWEQSEQYRCSADNPSALRCTVPPSCCKDREAASVGRFCGSGTQNSTDDWLSRHVYQRGCVMAAVEAISGHALVVGCTCILVTIALAIAATTAGAMSKREQSLHATHLDQDVAAESPRVEHFSSRNEFGSYQIVDHGSPSHQRQCSQMVSEQSYGAKMLSNAASPPGEERYPVSEVEAPIYYVPIGKVLSPKQERSSQCATYYYDS
ncbi:tetraspanin-33-like isoform X2 [Ornithodoros turicata]|uniref:tetraspanin-33-like isoform X2 n=1 Tax=Ornithodoros turicata TaxID=34597 RepID=UPI0031392A6F